MKLIALDYYNLSAVCLISYFGKEKETRRRKGGKDSLWDGAWIRRSLWLNLSISSVGTRVLG